MNGTNRREFLRAAGVLGATATLGAGFPDAVAAADESGGSWSTYRGNPGRTGATADGGPGSNVTTDGSFDLGGGMYSVEPVVAEGTLFLAVTTANGPSTTEGYVAAHDPTTGEERWRRDGVSIPMTPTVGDGTVYFDTEGSEDSDATGFYALDSASGETKWHRPESFGLKGPLAANGRLYGTVSGDACELDPETGDVLWRTEGVGGEACYADGTLFYGDGVALNADGGSVRWNVSGDGDELRAVADGQVYGVLNGSGGDPGIRARSADDGTVRWSYSFGTEDRWWGAGLAVAGGRVFVRVADTVRALDARSGREAWTYDPDAELAGAPTVGGDTLYVGGRTNPESDAGEAVVVAVDAASGEREWRHTFGSWDFDEYGPAANTPVVADGRVYTATYPMRSTLDHTYIEHGDFHVLGSDDGSSGGTTTTSDGTTTTSDGTTTTGGGTTTTGDGTTTTITSGVTGTSETGSTDAAGAGMETTTTATTATDGQPGFGILGAVGGLASVGAYLRARIEGSD